MCVPAGSGKAHTMVGRALVHGTFVALVVLLALAKPDLADRSDPPWLDEVCVHYDACDPTPTSQPDR